MDRASFGLKAAAAAGLAFLHLPILLIFLYAFTTEEKSYAFPPPGLTTKWFAVAWNRADIWPPLALSLQVALIATVLALILGTLAAGALSKGRFFGQNQIALLLILPIALPGVVTGIALRSAFSMMDIPYSTWTIILGHATFCIVIVYNNAVARMRRMSGAVLEASADLGANAFQTFRHVLLPNLGTALLAGGMLAFALSFDEVIVTTPKEGETLKRYAVNHGDILMADRGYAHPPGIAHVVDAGGEVIIRANLVTLPLVQRNGGAFDILTHLRQLGVAETGDWPVAVKAGKRLLPGRLCAIKKSAAAAEKGQQRVRRESQRGQWQVQPQTLEAAAYVFVFTTVSANYSAARILELYRVRWQIELTFKRLKSLVSLGHLKKHDDVAARSWLQGKLLVAFLIDRLLALAERVSPWGYPFEEGQTPPLPMAGDRVHA